MENLYTEKKVRELLKEQREICAKHASSAQSVSHFKDMVLNSPSPMLPASKLNFNVSFTDKEIDFQYNRIMFGVPDKFPTAQQMFEMGVRWVEQEVRDENLEIRVNTNEK